MLGSFVHRFLLERYDGVIVEGRISPSREFSMKPVCRGARGICEAAQGLVDFSKRPALSQAVHKGTSSITEP
jgi:hypothetical protein